MVSASLSSSSSYNNYYYNYLGNDDKNDSISNCSSKRSNNNNNATFTNNTNHNHNFVLCVNCHALFDIQVVIHYKEQIVSAAPPPPESSSFSWMMDYHYNHQWFLSLDEIRLDAENSNMNNNNKKKNDEEEDYVFPLLVDMLTLIDKENDGSGIDEASKRCNQNDNYYRHVPYRQRSDDETIDDEGEDEYTHRTDGMRMLCFVAKVPVPYSILAKEEEEKAWKGEGNGGKTSDTKDDDDDYSIPNTMWRRETIVMASLWREENEDDISVLLDGDIHTNSVVVDDFYHRTSRQRSTNDHTTATTDNASGEIIGHPLRRIIVDRQLVNVILPTTTTTTTSATTEMGRDESVRDSDSSTSRRHSTRSSQGIVVQHHHDPIYTVRLEDTVNFVYSEHFSKHKENNDKTNEDEEKKTRSNDNDWYRIACASFTGGLGGMIGLLALMHTLPTAIHDDDDDDDDKKEEEDDNLRTPSPQRSTIDLHGSDMPRYTFEEHGMKGVRLFHHDDESSSSGQQQQQQSSRPSSSSPLLQGDGLYTTSNHYFECNDSNVSVPSMSQRKGKANRRSSPLTNIIRNIGSRSNSQSWCPAQQRGIKGETDGMYCTNVANSKTIAMPTRVDKRSSKFMSLSDASAEEMIHSEPLEGSLEAYKRNHESVKTNCEIERTTSSPGTKGVDTHQSPQFPCIYESEPDSDRAMDNVMTNTDCGYESVISRTESTLEMIACHYVSTDKTQISEEQVGEKTDGPTSPPKIVRTPNSRFFDPVVSARSIAATLTSDEQQKVPALEQKGHSSPKVDVLEPSVTSSAATVWIHNRSSNHEAIINNSKRKRQQSSTDTSVPGSSSPLYNTNCSQYPPEVAHPHVLHEAENENDLLCQHNNTSQTSFGQENDTLLSSRSLEHNNGLQHIQNIHLNISLSPSSTVAATVHEHTTHRRKMGTDNVDGDRPLPIPCGEVGQSKRFGLVSTHDITSSSSLDIPDLKEQPLFELDNRMKTQRSKRKIRKIEKRLLATTKKPFIHIPSSTLISLSQEMEEPPSWQFSSE